MPIKPKHTLGEVRPSAARQFTDREDFIAAFRTALAERKPDAHRVLVYYGVGGVGKTSLRKELCRQLESEPNVVQAVLDFDVAGYRDMEAALFVLGRVLRQRYKIQFPTFDLAYAVYWQRTRPQTPLTKSNFPLADESMILTDILSAVDVVPIVGLIPRIPILLARGHSVLQKWWTRRGSIELRELPGLEPVEIAERLPMFWAADLKDWLGQRGSNAVLFLDTYEALTEAERSEGKVLARDEWVRELVAHLPGVLWVLSGRERLRWEEMDPDWKDCLHQHLMGGLAERDARSFLASCGIGDETVQGAIVAGSGGVPHFLDLAVDTYLEIKTRHNREPQPDDFARTPKEMLVRFLRHLTQPEIETLKVLSAPRVWDFGLFELLITRFRTGYPSTAFADLCRFSFIDEGATAGTWTMHQLMRQGLQEHQASDLSRQVHRFLYEHYGARVARADPRNITQEDRSTLAEAFYHAGMVLEARELFAWFSIAAEAFSRAAQWSFLLPLYHTMTARLEQAFGPEDPDLASSLSVLAELYRDLSKFAEAEPLHRRALDIRERVLGPKHPDVATTLNRLGLLLFDLGRYGDVEPMLNQALAVRRQTLGEEHPEVAQTLNSLARLYSEQGRYAEAERMHRQALAILEQTQPGSLVLGTALTDLAFVSFYEAKLDQGVELCRRALAIHEHVVGTEHPRLTYPLNTLAMLCEGLGKYAEAERLHQRALAIAEGSQGSEHFDVARVLSNLGLLYDKQRRFAESWPLYQRALGILEGTFGPDHPYVAACLHNMAENARSRNQHDAAGPLYERALSLLERILGQDHVHVATCCTGMAENMRAQGRYSEAGAFYRRALGICDRVLEPDHPDRAWPLECRASCCRDEGRHAEAEELYRRALAIREKALGTEHPDLTEALEGLAKLYEATGRTAEAVELAERARRIRASAQT